MSKKRSHFDLDPDYEDVTEQQSKRQRVLEEGAKEATKNKIEAIIRKQFGQEIENKEAEIMNISENLERSRTILDRLRACIVASYYGNANQQKCLQNKASQQTPMIHPTVKKYLGKAPKGLPAGEIKDSENLQAAHQLAKIRASGEHGTEKIGSLSLEKPSVMTLPCQLSSNSEPVAMTTKVDPNQSDTRSGRFKVKKRIIVGNVSKTIPADRRDENDQATHKWMVYVRGPKESPRIDHFVKKVWFFLHPSYRPNDLVEVSEHPFHLTRRGWGEFPVRVQLHFKDSRNKRLDIIHNLKLDRTYTSLQTLGAETVVDIELERDVSEVKKKTKVAMATGETTVLDSTVAVKQEPVEYNGYLNNTSTLAVSQNHVQVEFDPGGHEYMNKSTRNNQIPEIKLEPTDHDYGISTHGKPLTKSPNVKQEKRSTANLGISGANNNLRLVFSGLGTQGISNVISPQGIQNSVSASISPVKTGLIKQTSPKSQNKGQAVVQLGSALTLQGVGSLSNSGLLISNQQAGKQNLVPVLLGNSPTKISGNQPIFQPGSVLLSTALPASTQVTGSQTNSQSGSLVSPSLPLSQSVPQGNQTNNPGLVFLKCTDNQGKTYLIPQQICPTVQTSNNIATPVKGHSAVSNKSANSKVPVSLSGSQIKVPVSAPLVSLSQLTAVGLHPKQAPVQLAGPLIFIKPEEMPKPGSQSKSSPPNLTVNTKSFQTLKLITPPKSQGGININSAEGKNVANQSSMRGQLKVTSQGLITVQNDDASYNKNLVSKTEPTDDSSVKGSSIQVASSVAKQPIIILPHNNKAPVSLQCNPTLLQSSGMKLSSGSTLSNFIIVNASKTSQKLESTCLTNTTPSCGTKSSPAASLQKSGAPKTNMLLLQTKTTGSDKPNHLVIVPVSCASSTVTRPTVSIATMSCSGKSLIVSKALPTVCSTLASFSTTSLSSAASLTSTDKNKTMYIVVEGNTTKERSAQVSDGQRSMTSLLSKVPAPVSSSSTSSGLNNSKQPNVKLIPAQSLLSSSGLISSSSSSSSLFTSSSASLLSASSASLLSSSPASLLSTSSSSSSVSASAVPSFYPLDNTIPVTISTSGQKETKVLVVNSNNPVTETPKPWKPDEKKIISLGPKKKKVFKEPEKTIRPLGSPDDYPDLLSLVRAAVLRHPIVNENTAKHLHPYCSVSNESWLSWNVGKRRSSEWQRASSVQKFILSYLNGSESFKGEPLWSVKEILTWCRLHAYSPHYLEKPLHPTGLNLQAESSLATDKNHKFRSLSGYSDVLQDVTTSQKTTEHLDDTDENIDIISTDPPKVKVKTEMKDITESPFVEYLPQSEGARFVQETAKKIGVKFSPTEVEPGYYGHLSQDYIFSAMESFVGDILRETFALQVNMGRYPDALGVADVYRALSNLPITDFITNKYSGVEDTGGVPTSYR